MSARLRQWFTTNLQHLLHQAGSPSYRELARSTHLDTTSTTGRTKPPDPDSPFEVARRVGIHPRPLSSSTIHDLVTGHRESAPDAWVVSMFVIACACWGARHGSRLLPDLSADHVRELVEKWAQRRADYEQLLDMRGPVRSAVHGESVVRVGVVPMLADRFQAREIALEVDQALAKAGTVILTPNTDNKPRRSDKRAGRLRRERTTVLAGLGGVGKTQLAAEVATRAWHDPKLRLAMWVTADSRTAITTAYADAAHRLLGVDPTDPGIAARRLLEWMASTDQMWMVVLDDLRRPKDLHGLWPTTGTTGQVMVTTRRRDPALRRTDRMILPVGVFTPAESESYLRAKLSDTGLGPDLNAGATELADTLGHLPLALAHAAAYQLDRGLTCHAYRERFLDRATALIDVLPDTTDSEPPDGYQHTIATTWSLSIELANQLTPTGIVLLLLHVASLLDSAGIPVTVFTGVLARTQLLTGLKPDGAMTADIAVTPGSNVHPDTVADELSLLHRLSLISFEREQPTPTVRIHALVQRAIRDTLRSDYVYQLARTTASALLKAWPTIDTTNPSLARTLRANATILHIHTDPALWRPDGHNLLFRIGKSLADAGQVAAVISYYDQLHSEAVKQLGHDHPFTLATRGNLVDFRGHAGDLTGAINDYETLLADYVRVLGADNSSALQTRSHLADFRSQIGDVAGAITGHKTLLADQLRIFGPDHPSILQTRAALALCRVRADDASGAIGEHEVLLADHVRVLGPDHPDTLMVRANLAACHARTNDFASAMTEYETLLADRLRVLGPDHPDTLNTRASLTACHIQAGDVLNAITEAETLLADRLRVLGPDHLHILTSRRILAESRAEAGDLDGAITEYEALLADQRRVLDNDHPDTLSTRGKLAYHRGRAGDVVGTITEFENLLADQRRVLGDDHPYTVVVRQFLANVRKPIEHDDGLDDQ